MSQAISRKKTLLFFGAAVAVLVLSEIGASIVGPNTTKIPQIYQVHREGLASTQPETLLVGDSSMGAAVDPAAFDEAAGDVSYNLWQPSASMRSIERLTLVFGLEQVTPATVVLGVTGRMFNGSTTVENAQIQAALEQTAGWQRVVDPSVFTSVEAAVSKYSSLVRYRAGLQRPSDWYRAYAVPQRFETGANGHLTFPDSYSLQTPRPDHTEQEREALAGYVPGIEEFDALDRTISRLAEAGIAVYVVELPVYEPVYRELYPRGERDVNAFRAELRSRLDGSAAHFIDMTAFGDDASLFSDENHLNEAAAQRFAIALQDRMRSSSS